MKNLVPILTAFLFGFFLFSCAPAKSVKSFDPDNLIGPNLVKIDDDLFMDKTEMSNIYWKEYLYWNMLVFGKDSDEYNGALPDTNVWLKEEKKFHHLASTYFRYPEFDNFPVVGISQSQALDFANWRTDRVYEMMLIVRGALEPNPNQNRKSHFTVQNYLSGNYLDLQPDTVITHIPIYKLASVNEFNRLKQVYQKDNLDPSSKEFKKSQKNNLEKVFSSKVCPTSGIHIDPNANVKWELYNVAGNVAEWTSDPNTTFGNSWKDESQSQKVDSPNAMTGMRCSSVLMKISE